MSNTMIKNCQRSIKVIGNVWWNKSNSHFARFCEKQRPISTSVFLQSHSHHRKAPHTLGTNALSRNCPSSAILSHQEAHPSRPQAPFIDTRVRHHSNLALEGQKETSPLDWVRSKLGLPLKTKYNKRLLKRSALKLYLCCVELIDHDQFFQEFELEDTFSSWFRITELHLWMVFSRIMAEGYDGRFVRNNMLYRFWEDVKEKARKMGPSAISVRQDQIKDLGHQMRHALFAYDEGLFDDDRVLAGALWRTFFSFECTDAEKLEKLVLYVRKQLRHLDELEGSIMLQDGLVTFLPLEGHTEDTARSSRVLKDIFNRVA